MSTIHTKDFPDLFKGHLFLDSSDRQLERYTWIYGVEEGQVVCLVDELSDDEIQALYAYLKREKGRLRNIIHGISQRANINSRKANIEEFLDSEKDRQELRNADDWLGKIQLEIDVIYKEGMSRPSIKAIMEHVL